MSFPMGGRPELTGHRFPEASGSGAVRVPERLTERCCSFGVRGWQPRNSPAQGRCGVEFTYSSPRARSGRRYAGQPILRSRCFRREASSSSGRGDRLAVVGAFAREVRDSAGQLAHRPGDGDAEHALPALQQVDDLFGRGALIDRGAVGEQRDVGQVLHTALAQMVDRDADVVQRDAGVEQPLDDLENQDVLERIQPLAAGSRRAANRRHHQRRACPVVQLAVGDAGDLARTRAPIADQFVGHRVVGEQTGLHRFAWRADGLIGAGCCGVVDRGDGLEVQLVVTWLVSHGASSRRSRSLRAAGSRDCSAECL